MEFLLGVGRHCCIIISKWHVPDENLAYLCLGPETGEVEEPAIRSVTKVDSVCSCVEGVAVATCTCDTFPLAFNRRCCVVVATCDTFPIVFNRRLAARHT